MRSSNKSRSRNKNNNRNRNVGNIINRVFDSAGPEGKVRGTPQQIIEKYQTLARDAQLSGDRVAAENFQQHSEHYARMLAEAQREIAERQSQQEAQNQRHGSQNSGQNTQDSGEQPPVAANAPQPEIVERPAETPLDVVEPEGNADLVETPEAEPKPKRTRARRPAKAAADQPSDGPSEPQPAVE